ncbi:MAG: 2-oxoglutarate dehydrogenase E1 component [Actinomycetota bacterium]|nr:2-oxoglutarate dehydrogenase E1 component [Actinomycetota bacterium]
MQQIDGLNSGYARVLLDEYLENPEAVPPEWRELFERGDGELVAGLPGLERLVQRLRAGENGAVPAAAPEAAAPGVEETLLAAVAAAASLVKAYRTHGHLAARLDPLGTEPVGDPALEPDRLVPPLTPELQSRIPASLLRVHVDARTLADALPRLVETYCGTLAYEIEHISNHEERVWLRHAIESGRYRRPLSDEEKRALLRRLSQVEGLEEYLRRTFLGQKQFSVEGLDVLVPMLDEAVRLAGENGAHEVVIGMAHRGRLNVLAHVVGLPYEAILREFEGERTADALVRTEEGGSGDVKYHVGATGTRSLSAGEIAISLSPNPSHLEFVDPVVEGRTRAKQTDRSEGDGDHDPRVAMAILIHGDASFPAQGVVAETLNLQGLAGYTTGGTLHVIANNQVGFTTDPEQGRSTRYSSDLAKGFDIPIVHVNADDPEASISAIRLAMAFRQRFGHDAVVDLVGYRRLGHNEQDEAAYTQPLLAQLIAEHPSVLTQFVTALVADGVVTEEDVQRVRSEVEAELRSSHARLRSQIERREVPAPRQRDRRGDAEGDVATAVPADVLKTLNRELLAAPDGFTVHPKLARQLERRAATLESADALVDWGQAEALAFASLLVEGIPIRLTGQDTERGTFSQRHLVLHDAESGELHTPMQHLRGAGASFEIHNSPLSELAAVGFEYGYAASAPDALVLWEAQFGDFVNGAQVIVDQFIVSGLSKWRETSRLTLLLPHGYEGNGPEHSSARLERFLQLAAENNVRIANCTTSAQYFHLLRRQALLPTARPLIVMTPKGLLRLREASSPPADFTEGSFAAVLDDPAVDREGVRRLVLCSGKIYYDIAGHEERGKANDVAVARLEQVYPFPVEPIASLMARYPALQEVVWAQEEPQNMGAWRALRHRLEDALPDGVTLRYVGRPWRASSSEGYPTAHLVEQDRIVRQALTG